MKLKDKILSIPSTIDPILDDLSHGVDPDEIVEIELEDMFSGG